MHRPPYGASASLSSGSAEESCSQLVEELSRRGIERFHLAGHSYGAYLALHIALSVPDRVGRCSLLSPVTGVAPEEILLFEGGASAFRAGADLTDTLVPRWVAPRYLAEHPEVTETIRRWQERERAALADDLLQASRVEDLRPRLADVRPPCLVRAGALDVAAPPEAARSIASAIPGARLELVDGAGHLLAFEDLEGTAASLRRFHGRDSGGGVGA